MSLNGLVNGDFMNYYISDLHFGHSNAINFDHRPFADIEEMDRQLILNWNAKVTDDDNVYIIGDFCYRNKKPADWYLEQLRGHKYLVIGNHDRYTLQNSRALSLLEQVDKMLHVSDDGNQICLCHFPIAEWNGCRRGHWHIYGHIHDKKDDTWLFMRKRERALNAAACINHYSPVTFSELLKNNQEFAESCHEV